MTASTRHAATLLADTLAVLTALTLTAERPVAVYVCDVCGALGPASRGCDVCALRATRARRARQTARDHASGVTAARAARRAAIAAAARPIVLVDASFDRGQIVGQTALPLPPSPPRPGQMTFADLARPA